MGGREGGRFPHGGKTEEASQTRHPGRVPIIVTGIIPLPPPPAASFIHSFIHSAPLIGPAGWLANDQGYLYKWKCKWK